MILVTAAMPEELQAFKSPLNMLGEKYSNLTFETSVSAQQKDAQSILPAVIGTGKVMSALNIQKLFDAASFEMVIHVGICGSLQKELPLYSLVFPYWALQHDLYIKSFGFKLGEIPGASIAGVVLNRKLQGQLKNHAEKVLKRYERRKWPLAEVHLGGGVLTGDAYVQQNEKSALQKLYKTSKTFHDTPAKEKDEACCADMEGFSIALAAKLQEIPAGMIRVVSDDAAGGKPVNFAAFMKESSALCKQIIMEYAAQSKRNRMNDLPPEEQ